MNVIIKIQERDAIPVRALPFVAGFEQFSLAPILSPYWIAMSAAMPNDPGIGNSLATFTIENGEIRQLAPNEWGAIIEQTDKPLNDAVRELPSGVFVFADDFTKWLTWLRCSTNEISDLDSLLATLGATVPASESPNLNPLVPDLLGRIILEGFDTDTDVPEHSYSEHESARIFKQLDSPDGIPSKIVVRKLNVMVDQLRPIWPNIKNDTNNGDKNGLRARAKLRAHGKWNMTAALEWAIENRPIKKDKAATIVASDPTSELSVLLAQMLNL